MRSLALEVLIYSSKWQAFEIGGVMLCPVCFQPSKPQHPNITPRPTPTPPFSSPFTGLVATSVLPPMPHPPTRPTDAIFWYHGIRSVGRAALTTRTFDLSHIRDRQRLTVDAKLAERAERGGEGSRDTKDVRVEGGSGISWVATVEARVSGGSGMSRALYVELRAEGGRRVS